MKKIIGIGGVKFYEGTEPETGEYIICSSKIVQVCQRKSGQKYGKVVAVGNRLAARGRFFIRDEKYITENFDLMCSIGDENEVKYQKNRAYMHFEEEYEKNYDILTHYRNKASALAGQFDEWMKKYPIFKKWVCSLAQRRGDIFSSDIEAAALVKTWDYFY